MFKMKKTKYTGRKGKNELGEWREIDTNHKNDYSKELKDAGFDVPGPVEYEYKYGHWTFQRYPYSWCVFSNPNDACIPSEFSISDFDQTDNNMPEKRYDLISAVYVWPKHRNVFHACFYANSPDGLLRLKRMIDKFGNYQYVNGNLFPNDLSVNGVLLQPISKRHEYVQRDVFKFCTYCNGDNFISTLSKGLDFYARCTRCNASYRCVNDKRNPKL